MGFSSSTPDVLALLGIDSFYVSSLPQQDELIKAGELQFIWESDNTNSAKNDPILIQVSQNRAMTPNVNNFAYEPVFQASKADSSGLKCTQKEIHDYLSYQKRKVEEADFNEKNHSKTL